MFGSCGHIHSTHICADSSALMTLENTAEDVCGQVACHEGMAKAHRAMGDEWLADAHVEEAENVRYAAFRGASPFLWVVLQQCGTCVYFREATLGEWIVPAVCHEPIDA
jgi:hypothetical protein